MTFHKLWEGHYEVLTHNIDACAERIRALGSHPLGTAKSFLESTTIKEHSGDIPTATEMVARLAVDHEQLIRSLRNHVNQWTNTFHNDGTADFLTGLKEEHEEMAWIEGESVAASGNRPGISVEAGVS